MQPPPLRQQFLLKCKCHVTKILVIRINQLRHLNERLDSASSYAVRKVFLFLTVLLKGFKRHTDFLMKAVRQDYVIMNHFTHRLKQFLNSEMCIISAINID